MRLFPHLLIAGLALALLLAACGTATPTPTAPSSPALTVIPTTTAASISTAIPSPAPTATPTAMRAATPIHITPTVDSPLQQTTPTPDFVGLARWAAQHCAIAEEFAVAITAATDETDPSTLTLEPRKTRAERISNLYIAASDAALAGWANVIPEPETELYQQAVVEQVAALRSAMVQTANNIAEATSVEDIETANAVLNIVLSGTQAKVDQAIQGLPDTAVAALFGVTRCGNVTPG